MQIVLSEFISLDGVVQAPGGPEEDTDGGFAHGGWSFPWFDAEVMGGAIDEVMGRTEALLFGRRTWSVMAAAWPDRAGDEFADRMNAMPKYVVSGTLTEADLTWEDTTLIPAEGALESIAALRDQPGGVLSVMGSSQLGRSLVSAGLVDEYLLMIEPVLLGGGKSIYPMDGELRPLELVRSTVTPTGVVVCNYRPGVVPPMPEFPYDD